ncbi:haloalkane dehalogenase [Rhodovibrionaceae bacterium A322]
MTSSSRRTFLRSAALGGATLPFLTAFAGPGQAATDGGSNGQKTGGQKESATPQMGPAISADFPFESRYITVKGAKMHYVEEGDGDPILFLHGNPTSSYLWRNILPYAKPYGRVIAPDLIGMGKSDQPELDYSYATHREYLDAFIEAKGLSNITLVVHDWGSALGMDYARRNPDRVKALAFMEAIIPPVLPFESYEAMGGFGELFKNLRTPGVGEDMVLKNNFFVEQILPHMGVVRSLSEAEMTAYRAPYKTEKSRLPTLVWPREIPIGGDPALTTDVVTRNGSWLQESEIPKILFYAEPGALTPPPVASLLAQNLKNIETNYVGPGTHFIQEDHPHEIGRGLADWLRRQKNPSA